MLFNLFVTLFSHFVCSSFHRIALHCSVILSVCMSVYHLVRVFVAFFSCHCMPSLSIFLSINCLSSFMSSSVSASAVVCVVECVLDMIARKLFWLQVTECSPLSKKKKGECPRGREWGRGCGLGCLSLTDKTKNRKSFFCFNPFVRTNAVQNS